MEIWKEVPNTYGYYKASNQGRFQSKKSGDWKIITAFKTKLIYLGIDFQVNAKRNRFKAHFVIATLFVPNPNGYKMVNHKDGDKTNNNDWNLEWCTAAMNIQHAWDTGLKVKKYGESNPLAILTQKQADEIRALRKQKVKQLDLCVMFNISRATCQRILYNKIYKSA